MQLLICVLHSVVLHLGKRIVKGKTVSIQGLEIQHKTLLPNCTIFYLIENFIDLFQGHWQKPQAL